MLEENLAYAEGGDIAVTFASGMAAISGVLGTLTGSGSEIVAHKILYGCTYSLLTNWYPRLKIGVKFVDFTDPDEVRRAITPNTRVLYMESPVNPTMRLVDLTAIAALAAEANASRPADERLYTVVDSTFATPFCQRPISLGIDFVVHSLTKAIGGFGTDIGGVVIGPRWSYDMLMLYRKDFGGILSSKSAWPVLVQGLPSLAVRMRQMQATASRWRSSSRHVRRSSGSSIPDWRPSRRRNLRAGRWWTSTGTLPPGPMIYFVMKGANADDALRARGALHQSHRQEAYCITLAVSLGNIRTLIEHPGSMTHSAFPADEQVAKGLDPGGVRLALGLEKPEDIIRDLGRH